MLSIHANFCEKNVFILAIASWSDIVLSGQARWLTMGTVRDLHDFLEEAELLHYYSALCNQLRISTVPQLKYVEEEDLAGIGMSKPEMRRLKKLYKKECPHGALGKIKKVKGSTKQDLFTMLYVQWEEWIIPSSLKTH